MRFVILTLDAHLTTAFERARAHLAREVPGLELSLHLATTWGDEASAERARRDVAQADILVATHLFIEDQIRAILPTIEARQPQAKAVVCLMSAGEVMRQTRMGKFAMASDPSKGAPSPWSPAGILKRLRGERKPGQSTGEAQMRQLRRIPQLLRFVPGTAQDVRAYYLVMQYWLAGSEENLANLVRLLVHRYGGVKGVEPAAPVEYPETGLYHPDLPAPHFATERHALPARGTAGRVGLVLMRSYLLGGNRAHYDAVIRALEARGLDVVPAFAAGLDARPAIERYFRAPDGSATIDALVSLTGFSLVGGPAYNDAEAARAELASLDVPYLAMPSVEFQTVEQWQDDARGLSPVEATLMIAIPELDGATGPVVFGGRVAREGEGHEYGPIPERVERLAGRVARLVSQRRRPVAERKVAIVLFNFPPNAGNTGTAAYLAVFESVTNLLHAMRREGYAVDVPATADELRERILGGNAERFGAAANVVARIPADEHVRRERYLKEIEAQWGPAPGRQLSDGGGLLMLGERFGNVWVVVQPAMGYEGDPMKLLFERGFAPTHAFSAFYRWLREDVGVDCLLHFGTHGALEFMPGKQVGLGATCWPDRLLGDVPNVYLYASNNPSEGTIAKRRGAATLVSYLTPPIAQAGLYRGLADLKATVERFRHLGAGADGERHELQALIQAQAAALDLVPAAPEWNGDGPVRVEALREQLRELEESLIPHGLHVVGEVPNAGERADLLAILREGETLAGEGGLGADAEGRLARVDALLQQEHELPALLRALDGRYIPPAPGADLLRNPDVLPTGRNLYGFDPYRMPSPFAVADGRRQAERLLAKHLATGAAFPETLALVLWGTDNMKTEGGPVAQALALMGARPRMDALGRLAGAELIPLAELGRPRVDVVISLSGIFRDLLPLQVRLLAEAALLAAQADEPAEQNFVRKHALAHMAALGCDLETAALRVFSNAEGAYGSNVNHLVESGTWQDEDELAETYVRRKGFAYGASGRSVAQPRLLERALSGLDAAYQNLDSIELGITDIDYYYESLGAIAKVAARAGRTAPVYVGDQTRGPGTVRTLEEQVALESRTRLLNPKWYEGMLKHGYEGVRQIEAHVSTTLGWSATTGTVPGWVYTRTTETYVLDPAMRDRLAALNPHAAVKLSQRLLEASERGFWQPDDETLTALREASAELEDRLEGVTA
jgi:magnesium chelatase subunit H